MRSAVVIRCLLALAGGVGAGGGAAAVLVEDTWGDGSRLEQNLPAESTWFAASSATLAAAAGALTGTVGSGSSLWLTYYTPEGTPSALAVGDTLNVTLVFTPDRVTTSPTTRGLRLGLFNYSAGGHRVTADGFSTSGANGANVQGYLLEVNFTQQFTDIPLRLRKRTNLSSSNLMGSSSDYTTMGTGGGFSGEPGFTDGTSYTLEFTVTRNGDESYNWVTVSSRLSGVNLDISVSADDFDEDLDGKPFWAFDALALRPASSVETAETLKFTQFKVEGPAGVPQPPSIVVDPQDVTATLGQMATFSVAASGSAPLFYQWYYNTTTVLPNATQATLTLTNLLYSQAGGYSVVVSNTLGKAASAAATLTVNAPDFTAPGLILDEVWEDGLRDNAPVAPNNAVWYASSSSSLLAEVSTMLGTAITSSRLWVGYFTDNPLIPVDLAVGRALKATLVFTPVNVAAWPGSGTARGLRFGLFCYADGGTRLAADGFSTSGGNGAKVTGYMLNQSFYTTFSVDTPMELRARNNLASDNLLGTTGDYQALGSGPAGFAGAPGFVSDTEYTLEFSVSRTATTTVEVSTRIRGGNLDLAYTQTDSTFAYRRFDAFAIRPNNQSNAAEQFNFKRFKVEVTETPRPFRITLLERPTPETFRITWESASSRVYQVQSRDSLSAGDWTVRDTLTASGPVASWTETGVSATGQRFYRVVHVTP